MDYKFLSQKGITKLENPYDVSNVLQCIINGVAGADELVDSQEFHDDIVQQLEENSKSIFNYDNEEHSKTASCDLLYTLPHERVSLRLNRRKSTPSFEINLHVDYQESVEKDLESPPRAREVFDTLIDPTPFGPFFRSTGTRELWVVKSDFDNLRFDLTHAGMSFPESFYLVVTQAWNAASVTKTKAMIHGLFYVGVNGRDPRNINVAVRMNPSRNALTVRFCVGSYQSVRTTDLSVPHHEEDEEV